MGDNLHARVAAVLGWTESETQSFSLLSLRELVRPVSPKLAHELTLATEHNLTRHRRTR
jgi:hypothetical protein